MYHLSRTIHGQAIATKPACNKQQTGPAVRLAKAKQIILDVKYY